MNQSIGGRGSNDLSRSQHASGSPVTGWRFRQLEDTSIASAMRDFRRRLQAGFPDANFETTRPHLALVYNARTLPGHCCWLNTADPMSRRMRMIPLYGCLECGRTHLCRARGLPQSTERRKELRRDEASDLCPLKPSETGSTFVCTISGREVRDAHHFTQSGGYDEWMEQRGYTYEHEDEGGGGGDDDAAVSRDGLLATQHASDQVFKHSQFSGSSAERQSALDARRAGAGLGRGLRHFEQHKRVINAARTETTRNMAAYKAQHAAPVDMRAEMMRAIEADDETPPDGGDQDAEEDHVMDLIAQEEHLEKAAAAAAIVSDGSQSSDDESSTSGDDDDSLLWTGDVDEGEAETAAEAKLQAERKLVHARSRRLQLAVAGDSAEVTQGTQVAIMSRPSLRDYDYWRRYYFIGAQALSMLFETPTDAADEPRDAWFKRARRIFTQRLPIPTEYQKPRVKSAAKKTPPPPQHPQYSIVKWQRRQYRQHHYRQFSMLEGTAVLAARLPIIPVRWMTTLRTLFSLLWPTDMARCDELVDFIARWIRLDCLSLANENRYKHTRLTYEDRVLKKFPPAHILAAFVLYLGQQPIVLIDGHAHIRVLRGWDQEMVNLFQSQELQRRIFGDAPPDVDILAREETSRTIAVRRSQSIRKRSRSSNDIARYSKTVQSLHVAPSARIGIMELMATTRSTEPRHSPLPVPVPAVVETTEKGDEDDEVRVRVTPGQPQVSRFACTIAQIHAARDRLSHTIMQHGCVPTRKTVKAKYGNRTPNRAGKRVQFTAAFFIQWFRDEALRCWPLSAPTPFEAQHPQ